MNVEERNVLLKAKLENAKKIVREIELTNDKSRRLEWRECKKVIKWLEEYFNTYGR